MKWLKWRNCFAHGCDRWSYRPLFVDKINDDFKEQVEESIEEMAREYSWSDKYRGIEYFFINTRQVPNSHIEKKIEDMNRDIDYHKMAIESLESKIPKVEAQIGKGRKTDPDEIERAKRKKRIDAILKKKRQLSSAG